MISASKEIDVRTAYILKENLRSSSKCMKPCPNTRDILEKWTRKSRPNSSVLWGVKQLEPSTWNVGSCVSRMPRKVGAHAKSSCQGDGCILHTVQRNSILSAVIIFSPNMLKRPAITLGNVKTVTQFSRLCRVFSWVVNHFLQLVPCVRPMSTCQDCQD